MNIATFRSFFHTTFPQHATATVSRVSPKQSLNNWEATKTNSALAMFCFEASYNLDEQALNAFICAFSETPFLNCAGLILELSFQKNGDFAVYVYAAIEKIQAIEQALTQEAAELDQQQAEYEAAQAENEAEEVAQSTQQTDANDPQTVDVSADITYQTLGINAKQALVLGKATAEQMQDNAPQEDAETSEPFTKLAHPQVLTNTQIAEFFEQYEKSTNGHYTVSLGGHFWDIGITPVPNTRKTVSITGAYSPNGVTGSIVIVGRKDNYTLALRYIYECIYKHIQKITQAPIIESITPRKGIHAIGNSMQEQEDLELIMSREIPCTCVGLSGEVLTDARLIWDYNPKLEQVTYQAFKETSEGLFHIDNVYWVIPQTPIQILWQMQAELNQQKNLIKNPNN